MSAKERRDPGHSQNTWAKDVAGKPVHISKSPSGRKGYFCLGCSNSLEAVQFNDPSHASYFRHQPRDLPAGEFKCTYSDETHRHKIAKEILQRIKRIKVPSVYKYPPKGLEGAPMLINRSAWVDAATVRNEVYFFENSMGLVEWSKNLPIGAHQLVKPDVTFFDQNDKPILLIELEATHRVTEEKKARLRHLGIDAIEVILPTGPFEEIEVTFTHITSTKWLFNGEEQSTRYVQPSNRNTEDVPSIDELQRGVFEETYGCRKSMVSNLIRALERCLESEPYRRSEEFLRSELSRVTENARRTQEELSRNRIELRRRVQKRFEPTIKELETREAESRKALDLIAARHSNLENRYRRKRAEISSAWTEIQSVERSELGSKEEIESESRKIEGSIGEVQSRIDRELDKSRRIHDENADNSERIRKRVAIEEELIASEEAKFAIEEGEFIVWAAEQELAELAKFSRIVSEGERRIRDLETKARAEHENLDGRRETLERKFKEKLAHIARASLDYLDNPATGIEREVKAILSHGGEVVRFEETEAQRKRIEGARKSLANRTYKEWYRPK